MIGKLSSAVAGTIGGVLLTVYISMPMAISYINSEWPVYSKPTDILVEDDDGKLTVSATVQKLQDCQVIVGESYASLSWQSPYGLQKRVVQVDTPAAQRHIIGALYAKGDTVRLADRVINLNAVAEKEMIQSFTLLLPCQRLGYRVVAEIGPFPVE